MKSYLYLGFVAVKLRDIPKQVIDFISGQLSLSPVLLDYYIWWSRTFKRDLSLIRQKLDFEVYTSEAGDRIKTLITQESFENSELKHLSYFAVNEFRKRKVELPSKESFHRLVSSGRNEFVNSCHREINERINRNLEMKLNEFLEDESGERDFNWIKQPERGVGIQNCLDELKKLKKLQEFVLPEELLEGIPDDVQKDFVKRVRSENLHQLRAHTLTECRFR